MKNLQDEITEILDSETILNKLFQLKIEKINIIGGEPLLYPFTLDIIKIAKNMGFVTSITSNGSLLTKSRIKMFSPYLDWIGLSVDSKYEDIEREMGRGCGKHVKNTLKICEIIKEERIKLKVSTTVTKLNYKENMKQFIRKLDPNIWENLQVSFKKGLNEDIIRDLSINETEFENYIYLNKDIILRSGEKPDFKRSEELEDSCFILSPNGDILISTNNSYERYSLGLLGDNKNVTCLNYLNKYNWHSCNCHWN